MFVAILLLLVNCYASFQYSDWIGTLEPTIGNLTVLDISLPGTHDSLTYDLSEEVSLGADDDSETISWILHWASKIGIFQEYIGKWIRKQAKTQGIINSNKI